MTAPPLLRSFQEEIVACARDQNVVMVGDTGIGKTFVAIALLSEQDYGDGKRAFFLAPTRQLVWQITAKIRAGTTLRASAFCGRAMDLWGAREWERELRVTRVFVCTPEVLRNALEKGFVKMDKINLLVFDECHHVTKRHPYAHVIKLYDADRAERMPRVFGTTACPTRDCAKNLHATLKKVELEDHETVAYAAVAPIQFETYEKEDPVALNTGLPPVADDSEGKEGESDEEVDALGQCAEQELKRDPVLSKLSQILSHCGAVSVMQKLLRNRRSDAALSDARRAKLVRKFVLSCVEIYQKLGPWCVYKFIELEIERSAINASLLLHTTGSMYGYDSAAKSTILKMRNLSAKCEFAATKRLEKVAQILEDRLADRSDLGSEDEKEESEEEGDEEDDYGSVVSADADSLATTHDALFDDHDPISSRVSTRTTATRTTTTATTTPTTLQGIVFVTTRSECRVVCEYLNERLGHDYDNDDDDGESAYGDDDGESTYDDETSETNSGGRPDAPRDPRFACILGQAASRDTASFMLPKMEDTLAKFEKGRIQFLVSTAVSIEGVDFPQCSLIVVADRIQAARKLIQLRGRARHEDGVVYYLAETGDREHRMHFDVMKVESDAINQLDFRHDKRETPLQQPRSQAVQQLAGFAYFPDEAKIKVASTGAVLDMDASVSRINMFCQTLSPHKYTIDYKTMYTFEQTQVQPRPLFRARLQLPVELEIEPFVSQLMHAKATAKAAVAFEACKYLLENGLLDASLGSVYRKQKTAHSGDDLSFFIQRLHT